MAPLPPKHTAAFDAFKQFAGHLRTPKSGRAKGLRVQPVRLLTWTLPHRFAEPTEYQAAQMDLSFTTRRLGWNVLKPVTTSEKYPSSHCRTSSLTLFGCATWAWSSRAMALSSSGFLDGCLAELFFLIDAPNRGIQIPDDYLGVAGGEVSGQSH